MSTAAIWKIAPVRAILAGAGPWKHTVLLPRQRGAPGGRADL